MLPLIFFSAPAQLLSLKFKLLSVKFLDRLPFSIWRFARAIYIFYNGRLLCWFSKIIDDWSMGMYVVKTVQTFSLHWMSSYARFESHLLKGQRSEKLCLFVILHNTCFVVRTWCVVEENNIIPYFLANFNACRLLWQLKPSGGKWTLLLIYSLIFWQ